MMTDLPRDLMVLDGIPHGGTHDKRTRGSPRSHRPTGATMKRPSHCLSLPILACLTAGLVESPAFSTGLVDRRASIEIEARTTISRLTPA